jgi:hypothetical protein
VALTDARSRGDADAAEAFERFLGLDAATSDADHRARPFGRRLVRLTARAALVVAAVMCVLLSVSVVAALRTPGNEGFRAKWADWLRDHQAEGLVTPLEDWYFERQQPSPGGQPIGLNVVPATEFAHVLPDPTTTVTSAPAPKHLTKPADVPLVVDPALPNEGRWQPTGPLTQGVPSLYVVQFRADDVYTSQLTSAVWCDPTMLRVRLVPGAREPGGAWPVPSSIVDDARRTIVAAFNGGFRFKDAHGGFFFGGNEAVPLQNGAASIVIAKNGRINIGMWGRDMSMNPDVDAVLQNLTLLVDGGQIDPAIGHNDTRAWGATLKGRIAVARSGIGVTADGALIYVAGPALTAKSLAESLQRAGAVRAMTLDINPEWVTFNLFEHPDPADPTVVTGVKLYPEMQRSADRYLDTESRDFFTISLPQ